MSENERHLRDLEAFAKAFEQYTPKPQVRYSMAMVPIPLLRTIAKFLRTGAWTRTEQTFTPVHPGEPGYEDALYESAIIYNRAEMDRLGMKFPLE